MPLLTELEEVLYTDGYKDGAPSGAGGRPGTGQGGEHETTRQPSDKGLSRQDKGRAGTAMVEGNFSGNPLRASKRTEVRAPFAKGARG